MYDFEKDYYVVSDMTTFCSLFEGAIANKASYIAVHIKMKDLSAPEVIINPYANFETKLAYYKKAYNDLLNLKTCSDIRIVGVSVINK